jgi:hypothetical protein
MKSVRKYYIIIMLAALCSFAGSQTVFAQELLSHQEKKVIIEFEKQAKDYSQLRERIENQLQKLPKDATAEQIENHKISFQKAVQSARSNSKQGDIFTPAAAQAIRKIIKNEFKGKDRLELRQAVFEAETAGVPVKINYPYPDSKEQIEMPPTLLLALPQLPKQLRYRFVGKNFLLVDRENGLILDYMTNALP